MYSEHREMVLVEWAKEKAFRLGKTIYVVEIDQEEYRELILVDRKYVESDEFIAFEGKVLWEVSPVGDVF